MNKLKLFGYVTYIIDAFKDLNLKLCMGALSAKKYVCFLPTCSAHRCKKRTLTLLEMELEIVVRCHVLGTRLRYSVRADNPLKH